MHVRPRVALAARARSKGNHCWSRVSQVTWMSQVSRVCWVMECVRFVRLIRLVRFATKCSGAEAPYWALKDLIGVDSSEHLWGADRAETHENPRRFILRHCKIQHLLEDICSIPKGAGACAEHGGTCRVPIGKIDIFVGGFPCSPFSFPIRNDTKRIAQS